MHIFYYLFAALGTFCSLERRRRRRGSPSIGTNPPFHCPSTLPSTSPPEHRLVSRPAPNPQLSPGNRKILGPWNRKKKNDGSTHRCVSLVRCECRNDGHQGAELDGSRAECPEEHGALSASALTAENASPARLPLEFSAKTEPPTSRRSLLGCYAAASAVWWLRRNARPARSHRSPTTARAPAGDGRSCSARLAASPVCQGAHKNTADQKLARNLSDFSGFSDHFCRRANFPTVQITTGVGAFLPTFLSQCAVGFGISRFRGGIIYRVERAWIKLRNRF